MTDTPEMKLTAALAKALPALGSVHKNKTNPHFKSSYADLAAVLTALAPLTEFGIWFRQSPVEQAGGVAYETFYIHESGATLSAGVTSLPVDKANAQGYGSAQTYCRRYGLMAAFGLAADDDDGNAAAAAPPKAKAEPMTDATWAKLAGLIEATDTNIPALLEHLGIKAANIKQLTAPQAAQAIDACEAKLAKMAKAETDAEAMA